jgi:superfamily II DNA/RNA helicase
MSQQSRTPRTTSSRDGALRTGRRPVRRPSTAAGRTGSDRTGSDRTAPRRSAVSALEAALTAAAEAPVPPSRTFAELGMPSRLVAALARRGVHEPFAIQARVLPDALAGRDVLGRAQTGSGKTLAFGLPVLARLAADGVDPASLRTPTAPRALVLVPTRELARQVADELEPLAQALALRVTTVYGGAAMGRQIDDLRRGVDLVVATPGRLIDLMERRSCRLDLVEVAILDEADHMADLGFLPAVRRILDATDDRGQRLLLSATLDRGVDKLVAEYLREPVMHAVASANSPVEDMDHRVFTVRAEDKIAVAAEIAARPARTLFFVRTKHGADRLAKRLGQAGVEAAAIHGNLSQNQRQRAIDGFSAGSPRVLVATDVAARGLHVDDVDLVVHFDLPNDHKDYLHRSGRTARAGNSGTVVAFAEPAQRRDMIALHRDADVTATTVEVHAGHEAVREIAESGEPVVIRPMPSRERGERPAARSGGRRSGAGRPVGAGRPAGAGRPVGAGRPAGAGQRSAGSPRGVGSQRTEASPRQGGSWSQGSWSQGGSRSQGSWSAGGGPSRDGRGGSRRGAAASASRA